MVFTHSNNLNIKTQRLLLRPFQMNDIEDMQKNWITDPHVQIGYGEPSRETADDVKKLLNTWIPQTNEIPSYRWAIILDGCNECIGQIGFCCKYYDDKIAEVEYCIGRNFRGNGYAFEALNALIEYTFSNTDF